MAEVPTNLDPHDDGGMPQVAGLEAAKAAAAPAPAATDYKLSEDGNIVEVGGKKYITEAALQAERQARQKISETLTQLEPLMPEFNEFLENKRNGRASTVARVAAPAPAEDEDFTPDELEGLAIVRGYYDANNKPDTKRARQELKIMQAIADRQSGRAVQPVAEATLRDRAAQNHATARTRQFLDGEPIADQAYIDAAFNALPDEQKADPLVANLTNVIAAGLEYLDLRRQGKLSRGRREPVFREGGSGRRVTGGDSGTLDALDAAAARARGKTPEQWGKMQKALGGDSVTGTVLEDI